MSKKDRNNFIKKWAKYKNTKKEKEIIKMLETNNTFKKSKIIGLYYPIKNEINIHMLNTKNKKIAYPKIKDGKINFYLINNKTKWEKNKFGINEPKNGIIIDDKIDLLIVPALAINKNKYRIGYGKGYYDRYLKLYQPKTITLIYKEFIIDFKEDIWDQQIDEIISI